MKDSTASQKHYFRLNTYEELVHYALKKLGAPVLNIEVTDEQIQDRVTDALQFYLENDLESVAEFWWIYKVTQADIDTGCITLPLDVLDLLDVYSSINSPSDLAGFGSMDDPEFQWFQNFWTNGNLLNANLAYYEVSMQYLALIKRLFTADIQFTYRPTQRKLYLYGFKPIVGETICFHGNKMLDADNEDDFCIWNSAFLKDYVTALIGVNWGINITKYTNIPSAAGVTLDGQGILQRYTDMKTQLEQEFLLKHTEPPLFFWG